MSEQIEAIQKGSNAMFRRMVDDAQNRVEKLSRALILNHVRPLFIRKGGDNYSALGSGILFQYQGAYFLASAAHVFDAFAREKEKCQEYELTTFGQGQTVILNENPVCSPRAHDDPERKLDLVDLGVLKISADNVEQIGRDRFLSPEQMDFDDKGSYRSLYCALAYPGKWNDVNWVDGPNAKPITPKPLVYTLNKSDPECYKAHNLSEEQNIFVEFTKKKSKDTKGRRIIAPDPFGMSGGGLWHFRKYDPTGSTDGKIPDFRLVGILIEWKKPPEGFLVTRLCKLRELLAKEFSQPQPRGRP